MMARNHIPFAMSCWWGFCLLSGTTITGFGSLAAGVGGLLPDIDHPGSAVGRRFRLISLPLSAVVGHRGITHSLIATIAMAGALLLLMTFPQYAELRWAIAPVCVGYLSHLLGDALTPSGIPLFYPIKRRYSFNLFKTRSRTETVFVAAVTLFLATLGGVGEQIIAYETNEVWRRMQVQRAGW